jgi:hypothetical protein
MGDPAEVLGGDAIYQHGSSLDATHYAIALKQADVKILRREPERNRDGYGCAIVQRGLESRVDASRRSQDKKQFPTAPRCGHD